MYGDNRHIGNHVSIIFTAKCGDMGIDKCANICY